MKMPFGQYKGTELSDLPESYFLWLLDIVDSKINPGLYKAVQIDFMRRFPSTFSAEVPHHLRDKCREIIVAGFRSLSKKYHPDMGGNTEDMRLLLESHSFLKGYVEGGNS